ncbi:TRAP dicarboxylate transporter, DctM subunit, unknown substrate 3 [Pseudonocardia sp. Ae168_Ps1]|uniref:TRAP transporter large permease n=1 Tax=unclassified Pseudonocardia TaxID=2619320 RepID=UPI0006CB1092|nr:MULTISPECIES: TRAP transporter large permease [unclassified Pseudonocardia]ALE74275.1 C4-dicarboxylate ABC transporter permease [Pseudonocardia sp. EC080625-04]ALL77674.1 C4-dicarboxylate ABC transporter permease [Pseudonocardia sp. EC080610-09]ALL80590.1 C4-dicarboxylate ABC transporter permease [Pseudonocardia sp. EC080619-01]OLL71509.1 TRAP dicarboxylate transporter, DctM subunit, unknown substrate 3 [Pseudonocardia sp. Ae168_Ps1]OLL76944.1 TRAP dicarboxylate transporter, DctM subunit, u
MVLAGVLVLLFALLLIRVPVGIAIGLSGVVGLLALGGPETAVGFLQTTPYTAVSAYTLAAIPLFILMAQLVLKSGVTTELFEAARIWVGRVPAGLGVATTTTGATFAAVSGSSTAAAAALASTTVPEMERQNYDRTLAGGLVAVVGTLAAMVPPSIILVFYAILAEVSVGQMLVAGLVPGLLVTLTIIVTTLVLVRRNPERAPAGQRHTMAEKIRTIPVLGPVAVLFLLVVGSIYFGLTTPTESAGLGVAGALAIGLARRRLDLARIRDALVETLTSTAMILLIISSAYLFGYFMTLTGITVTLVEAIGGIAAPPLLIFALIAVVYLVLGAFLDQLAILALTVPVVLPLIEQLGFDPIWFGVLIILLAEIGLVTPPLGMNVFIVSSSTGRPAEEIFVGVLPYVLGLLVLVVLLAAVPGIVMWLPETMAG